MVAPLDAKASFMVEGETITLRLNFRALALAKQSGVNLMSGVALDPLDLAVALRCLAVQDHPDMTDEVAFAVVVRGGEAAGQALATLFTEFSGKPGGNVKAKKLTT